MSEHHDSLHHGHDDHHAEEAPHSTFKGYMIGFVASVILTAIPFWMVMGDVLDSRNATVLIILAFAVVQIVVHMVYFLHMDFQAQGGWTMLSLIFTLVLVFITLFGSLWVMYHMNVNMMPSMMGGS
ncbi:cytochrome o ubiquinol oxidase subunit IV [Parahaliea aestuarii]|uniref:Cytochrome bo(3) ubiquinol oxidase subunit 4 n=1 Tax=Parahaliea aestuarii TaxID=1852021 RepID=A0A5C8ZSR3_9GAMM|nr:cytochrome o ubiquinol oxidase subunit IV [Parahaliea aestuarii]TXS90351.1 cytochrome o ubiquinol oxidase subunit IV [Parahaliea aestuarii]